MKTAINICISACIIIFICACSSDDMINLSDKKSTDPVPTIVEEPDDEPTGDTPIYKSFTFKYKGNTYTTVPTFENTIKFFDEKTMLLYEEIQKKTTLCTYVRADGIVEYFDDFEEFINRPIEDIQNPPWEPLGETPKITYEFSLSTDNSSNNFKTKGVIVNNKELYQDYHDLEVEENGFFFKNSSSFTFSMINEKNTTSDIIPKWPVQYKFWLVFFDKEKYEGKTIAYNPNIHYSIGKKLVISEQLSNIKWDNRIACILIMMTPF
ncbi:MAG: hypothetical protein LBV03_06390 [Fusobacteriales bacterium]|jgi:hypothetical protein|nr:hypothetical protein [Fusobacteriales bacterium]